MKPTELSLTIGLPDIREIVDSIDLDGKVKTKLHLPVRKYLPPKLKANDGLLQIILSLAKDKTLESKDFDYSLDVEYIVQNEEGVKKIELSVTGATGKRLYYITGSCYKIDGSRITYRKTNIEGLLD